MDNNDSAFYDRFVNIKFPNKFFINEQNMKQYMKINKMEQNDGNLYIGDKDIYNTSKQYIPGLIQIIIEYYQIYEKQSLTITKNMKQNKQKYIDGLNIIKQYFMDKISKTDKVYHYIKWTTLFDNFIYFIQDEDMRKHYKKTEQ